MTRALIHPRLTSRISDFYPSIGKVESWVPTRSTTGAQVPVWTTKVESVRCAISPVWGTEQIGPIFLETTTHQINLDGYFPSIVASDRITVDGVVYDIQAVSTGIVFNKTQLVVKLVVPST